MLLLLTIICITVPVLLSVAFFTLAERQVMASMQRRSGPNVTGVFGILQAFADGLKLGIKEPLIPEISATGAFTAAPMIGFILSMITYGGIFISDSAFQGLVLMALSSLGVYGILLAGWSSNSKYAFLGCLRTVSLMISYELGFGAALLSISLFLTDSTGMKSLNFGSIRDIPYSTISFGDYIPFYNNINYVNTYPSISLNLPLFALLPLCIIFLICILAETKRVPFDLPEAEAELVAGYNVEYSSLGFALFFISEYANMISMSIVAIIYFFPTYTVWGPNSINNVFGTILNTALTLLILFFGYIWVRGTLPRYRYDAFLRLGWKALLPLSLSLYGLYAVFDYIY
uniref:NADH-ubiquinone oxidoreductase chain 1 n=1 Tax=Haematococcus lacustris TaxID=44745 RepID=A0A5B9R434_HAELA|nr:NADH dehydrogenase subunit 1 [Haematococcus lacustris]QEG54846.1 NADH dehydrogenase subunit 1 [Haematococcus lacustris]